MIDNGSMNLDSLFVRQKVIDTKNKLNIAQMIASTVGVLKKFS